MVNRSSVVVTFFVVFVVFVVIVVIVVVVVVPIEEDVSDGDGVNIVVVGGMNLDGRG